MGFCGNSNIQIWETRRPPGHPARGARKLSAARGGGYIFHSDHSVSSAVSGHTYDYIVKLVREYGNIRSGWADSTNKCRQFLHGHH